MKHIKILLIFLIFLSFSSCQNTTLEGVKDFNLSNFFEENLKKNKNNEENAKKINFSDLKKINYEEVLDEIFNNKNSKENIYNEEVLLENLKNDKIILKPDNLRNSVLIAVENHPKYLSALNNLNKTKAELNVISSEKNLKSNINTAFGLYSENKDTDPGLTVSLNASKMIYDAGSTDLNLISVKHKVDAAFYEANVAAQEVAINVLKTWLEVKKNEDILTIYIEGMDLAKPLLGQIKDISTSGLTEKNSLILAKKEMSNLEINLEKAKMASDLSNKKLENIYFVNNKINVGPIGNLDFNFDSITEKQLLTSLNEFKALNSSILSIQSKINSLEKTRKPKLSFRAGVVAPAEKTLEDGTANAGFLLNYVYDDGGALNSRIKVLESSLKIYETDLLNLNRNKALQFASLKKQYNISKTQEYSSLELVELSNDLVKTSKAQLVSGRSKIQDVLEAEVMLATNKIDFIKAKASSDEALIELYILLSGLEEFKEWNFMPLK